jgi:AcrR family transcriptional regulator
MTDSDATLPLNATPRATFRHGDLRQALLDAGLQLARTGGPAAVVLREATRRAGVAPNAAYRHYASQQALLRAVRHASLALVGNAFEAALSELPKIKQPEARARAALRALGLAYLRFAQDEPGWFRTAFCTPNDLSEQTPEKQGDNGRTPYELLCEVMDHHVEAGLLTKAQRPGAEFMVWSAVHGLALFFIDGPLDKMPRKQTQQMGERLLSMIEQGMA